MAKIRHRKKSVGSDIGKSTRLISKTQNMKKVSDKGIYTEYLDMNLDFNRLTIERKRQLKRISVLRDGRDVLVFAADFKKSQAQISITYGDLMPFNDQLSVLKSNKLDLILETPGGLGEVAEDIVKLMRQKFDEVNIIIPGWCKSAGTLIAMAGDEILMEPASALGPIDAQIMNQGKQFSADAFLEGLNKIKKEVDDNNSLNRAYIPILQAISPGEIQNAVNALEFAKRLVKEWLPKYKFKTWTTHSSTGKPVTEEEKELLADKIAADLARHSDWLTHGRSIKIEDLRKMKLRVTDYSEEAELADAIRRYFVLLQMTFDMSSIYKIFETPTSQIMKTIVSQTQPPNNPSPVNLGNEVANIDVICPNCSNKSLVQANLTEPSPLQSGAISFPADNQLECPKCSENINLSEIRKQIETQTQKKIV
jgi:ClpP class serine protease